MNKNLLKPKLYNGLFLGFGALFAAFVPGRSIAYKNVNAINDALGIRTTQKKEATEDTTYFSRTYTDIDSVKSYFKNTAIEVEGEGLVLMKNNNALPLDKNSKVSLLGTASAKFNYNTSGSSSTSESDYQTYAEAMKENGFDVNQTALDFYTTGAGKDYGRYMITDTTYGINEVPWNLYTDDVKNSISQYGDAAIINIARDSGEGKDITTYGSQGLDGSYLSLSQEEIDLLTNLTSMKKEGKIKKIVVLLNSSNMIQLDFMEREGIDVDALLWIGNVGAYGATAVCKALNGDINPSGRLSDTYAKDNFSSPAMASWALNSDRYFSSGYTNWKKAKLNATNRSYGVYNEGVYVGYRYYETRYEDKVMSVGNTAGYNYNDDVMYPFGYGLSYTEFSYSNFNVKESDDGKEYEISVDVKNVGKRAGKHTVEIYYQRPYTDYDKAHGIEKPAVELGSFEKTKMLEPNASETVNITLKKSQLKTYDADGKKTYILEAGDYYLSLGSDSHVAVNNILAYKNDSYKASLIGEYNADYVYHFNINSDDYVTYSKSEYTGETITNQLDHVDMNRYEGKGTNSVTYVSRNDWEGTWPKKAIVFTASEQMISDLSSHKALPSDGTMPSYNSGDKVSAISLRGLDFDDPEWDKLLNSMSKEEQIELVTSGQMSTAVVTSISLPGTFESDGPTATTKTKTSSSLPSEGIWASSFNKELIRKVGDAFAEDIIFSEYDGIYAPGVNIHRTPFGGRSNEYFSEDPYLTGVSATYEIKGLQGKGVITNLKHYAFNECDTERNGICIWLNEQEAREIMLLPFEMAVTEGQTGAIMTSFNRAGCIWTGADKNLSINILQKEWGFNGYSITDMGVSNGGTYMVYDDAYMGGSNLFMASANDLADYKDNAAFCEKVRDSAHRIIYIVVNKSRAMNGYRSGDEVTVRTEWWKMLINSIMIASGCIAVLSLALYILSSIALKIEP